MRTIKFAFAPVLLAALLSGCSFNSRYIDREKDKDDAEKIAYQFFDDIKVQKYAATDTLFSPKFWEVTKKEKMTEFFTQTQKKLGNLDSISVVACQSLVAEGTNPSAEYRLQFKNHYTKFDAVESLRMIREDNGTIKIVAYNINSEGFMK